MTTGSRVARPAQGITELPAALRDWFLRRGWELRPHQSALLQKMQERRSTLLIAPTGSGKTLAGFLPSLIDLAASEGDTTSLRTLYVSPLKALTADVERNLLVPIRELGLPIRIETRTGDTPMARKARQRLRPPHILLTTPEQLALLLSHPDTVRLVGSLRTVIIDELHSLAPGKRGDLLSLDLARLATLAPAHVRVGLSATVAQPSDLRAYLEIQIEPDRVRLADLVTAAGGAPARISILEAEQSLPWAGHTTRYAVRDVYAAIRSHRMSIVFVNTRSQAELMFRELWQVNDDNLGIGLHHGSLDRTRRQKVEAAMAAGKLRAVVATSTLDLGIDWGDVDLVVHVGAPKGVSRLMQRVGRANHRLDEPSQAYLVPSNRFEVLECRAAIEAAADGSQDAASHREGGLDVLAQHVWGTACSGPFEPDALFAEVRSAARYASMTRDRFDRTIDFVSTGGYALRTYERYARLRPTEDGRLRLAHPRLAQQYRLNVGTIVEAPMIKIRLVQRFARRKPGTARPLAGGCVLGELEEFFIEQLSAGDTFAFAGEVLRFEGMHDTEAFVTRSRAPDPAIPAYAGGKLPLSTHLADRVRGILAAPDRWRELPTPVCHWLDLQADRSVIPMPEEVLIEIFPHRAHHFMVVYPFEGRLAHQTLGMLLTRRLDRLGTRPLGFVASDYALAIWCRGTLSKLYEDGELDVDHLFAEEMLGDNLDEWLAESALMKRTFRICAVIAGLVERRHPDRVKSGRQVTISTDLIYDVLRNHDPHHILLEATWADAASGLLDLGRLGNFLRRTKGRIRLEVLPRVSPLAVPLLLDIGREMVYGGSAGDDVLREAAEILIREATSGEDDAECGPATATALEPRAPASRWRRRPAGR